MAYFLQEDESDNDLEENIPEPDPDNDPQEPLGDSQDNPINPPVSFLAFMLAHIMK